MCFTLSCNPAVGFAAELDRVSGYCCHKILNTSVSTTLVFTRGSLVQSLNHWVLQLLVWPWFKVRLVEVPHPLDPVSKVTAAAEHLLQRQKPCRPKDVPTGVSSQHQRNMPRDTILHTSVSCTDALVVHHVDVCKKIAISTKPSKVLGSHSTASPTYSGRQLLFGREAIYLPLPPPFQKPLPPDLDPFLPPF